MPVQTEVTAEDICYEAGLNDAAREITTGESVYSGPDSMCSIEEAYAYMDGRTWAYNNREMVTL